MPNLIYRDDKKKLEQEIQDYLTGLNMTLELYYEQYKINPWTFAKDYLSTMEKRNIKEQS